MTDKKPSRTNPTKDEPAPEDPPADEGADGLGYTARPTDHEPEGDKSPGGGSGDTTRK